MNMKIFRNSLKTRKKTIELCLFQFFTIICQVLSEEPHFADPILNVTVAVGRDANLACVVQNLGPYKVAWIHIDRQMILTIHRHVISRLARFSISHDNAMTWILHVSQVQQEDRGYYMCQVNTNPMISQVGYLQVVVPPNILDEKSTQSTVAVRENQNISLICKADGFPTPKIMWRREDGQSITVDKRRKGAAITDCAKNLLKKLRGTELNKEEDRGVVELFCDFVHSGVTSFDTLNTATRTTYSYLTVYEGDHLGLSKISRMEMGAYLCIATNGVPPSVSKRIILDVEFAPMIWVPNQLVGAPAGTDVSVHCHTEAHPRAISYWIFDNVMVLPTKKHSIKIDENAYRADMTLTLRNLQVKDFGNYKCISKNSLGETEGSIRLYEIPIPTMYPDVRKVKHNLLSKDDSEKFNKTKMKQYVSDVTWEQDLHSESTDLPILQDSFGSKQRDRDKLAQYRDKEISSDELRPGLQRGMRIFCIFFITYSFLLTL